MSKITHCLFPQTIFLYLKVLQAEEAICLKTEGKGREHGHLKEMTEIQNGWEGGQWGERGARNGDQGQILRALSHSKDLWLDHETQQVTLTLRDWL